MSTPENQETSSINGSPPSYDEARQQAGPLPSKRGELGFMEGIHVQAPFSSTTDRNVILPERHPADRDNPPSDSSPISPLPQAHISSRSNFNDPEANMPVTPLESPTTSNKPRILRYLKPKLVPGLGGVRLITLLAFILQFLLAGGFLAAWAITGLKLKNLGVESIPGGAPSMVFVHVVFAFAVVGQLIFLERRTYQIRAERYAHANPGEMLPRYRDRGLAHTGDSVSFGLAPWNRPPLPTYAAVLAQSGRGTGDVDDHLIAISPPPAYGNTRGSRMLLQGFLTDDLRAQRPTSVQTTHTTLSRANSTSAPSEHDEVRAEHHRGRSLAQLENSASSRT